MRARVRAGTPGRAGRGTRFAVLALALAGAVAGSCASPPRSPAPSPALHAVATANGYELPRTSPSGMLHVVFENRDTTTHELMFIRLAPGMTGDAYVAAVRSGADFPEGAIDCSGIGLTGAGERAEAWLRLEPGEYFLACWYRGHLERARVQTLAVTADTTVGITPPPADVSVRLADFQFDLRDSVAKGERVLKVETLGPSKHEMDIFRLEEGRSLAELRAWMHAGKRGPGPATPVGGVLDSHDLARVVWLKRDFAPGRYVLWCGMPMVDNVEIPNGQHADAGMVRVFVVPE